MVKGAVMRGTRCSMEGLSGEDRMSMMRDQAVQKRLEIYNVECYMRLMETVMVEIDRKLEAEGRINEMTHGMVEIALMKGNIFSMGEMEGEVRMIKMRDQAAQRRWVTMTRRLVEDHKSKENIL